MMYIRSSLHIQTTTLSCTNIVTTPNQNQFWQWDTILAVANHVSEYISEQAITRFVPPTIIGPELSSVRPLFIAHHS